MSGIGRGTPVGLASSPLNRSAPALGSSLLLAALHAPPPPPPAAPADDGSDVQSLVERALGAWSTEFTHFVATHVGAAAAAVAAAAAETNGSGAAAAAAPMQLPLSSALTRPARFPPSSTLLVRLPALLNKLRSQAVVSTSNFLERMVWAAASLKQQGQDKAAAMCFQKYMHTTDAQRAQQQQQQQDPLTGSALVAHVQALYGLHECNFRLLLASDPLLAHRSSLASLQVLLDEMRAAASQLLPRADSIDESLAWLLFNGCVSLWQMLECLCACGHGEHSVPHLNWIILAMESMQVLCSVRYLPFRVQIYIAVARAYENQADWGRAQAACQRALSRVREVASWEGVSQPVPARTLFLLRQSAQAISAPLVKYAWLQRSLDDTELESRLASDFQSDAQALLLLLEMLADPQARALDVFVADTVAKIDMLAEREKAEAARTKREEEAALTIAQEAAAIALAQAAGTKPATTSSSSKSRKSGTGLLLSSEAILAEVARCHALANAPPSAAGDKTDRSGRRKSAGGNGSSSSGGPASHKKKMSSRGGGAGEADLDLEPHVAPGTVQRDVRDPRAVALVGLALRKMREMLAQTTPLALLEAQALGLASTSLADMLDPDAPASKPSSSASAEKQPAFALLITHDLPGDWLPLRCIFLLAKAAFAAGCWAEFRAAADEFDARADPLAESPARAAELRADRSGPAGMGMEVQLQLLRRLLALRDAQVSSALGARGVPAEEIRAFALWLWECGGGGAAAASTALAATLSPTFSSTSTLVSQQAPSAIQACVMCPDLLTDACAFLWRFHLQPMLRSERQPALDMPLQIFPPALVALEAAQAEGASMLGVRAPFSPEHTQALLVGLQALSTMLRVLRCEDLVWVSQVTLELVALIRTNAGVDSECTTAQPILPRSALAQIVSVTGSAISALESHLGEMLVQRGLHTLGGTLHSIVARFDTRIDGLQRTFDNEAQRAAAEANPQQQQRDAEETTKPLSTELSRLDATLFCIYCDLLLAQYDALLSLGLLKALGMSRAAHAKVVAEQEAKYALTASYRKPAPALHLPTFNPVTEKKLESQAGANLHRRAMLLLAMLPFRATAASQAEFIEKRVQPLLAELASQERLMLRDSQLAQRDAADNVGGGGFLLATRFDTAASILYRNPPDVGATEAERAAALKRALKDRLPPPRLIARSCSCVVVRPIVPRDYQKRHAARGVILYGKASDTGVDVSTGNTEYYPLGIEFPLPALGSTDQLADIVLQNLPANLSWVFAASATDAQGQAIGSIGETSMRIVTAIPVPIASVHSMLAATLRRLGDQRRLAQEASQSAQKLLTEESKEQSVAPLITAPQFSFAKEIKSSCWALLAPFVRVRAQVSHAKASSRKGAARGLGKGDRLDYDALGTYSDDEAEEIAQEQRRLTLPALIGSTASKRGRAIVSAATAAGASSTSQSITSYANRTHTNGVHDSYTLGPAAADFAFRMDVWQLSAAAVQAAPRPLLYSLIGAANMHADCIALQPLVPPSSGSLQTKPLALVQLRCLEVVRSLLLGLQIAVALEEWRTAGETLLKAFDTLAPLLDSFTERAGASMPSSQLVLQPLTTLFQSMVLVRSALPYALVTNALQRASVRIVHALVCALERRHEHALLAHVLSQFLALQVATHASTSAAYTAAHESYRARQAQIELARLRASQLRDALAAEAAIEADRIAKEQAKELAKRSKKSASSSSKKKQLQTPDSMEESAPATQRSAMDGEQKEDGAAESTHDGSSVALSSFSSSAAASNPAIEAILSHPLLTASAGHRPHPSDYFRTLDEEQALVQFLLSRPAPLRDQGEKLAATLLGRHAPPVGQEDAVVPVAAAAAASAVAPASSSSAPPSSGEESVVKKRSKAGSGEEEPPARNRIDIEIALSEAITRALAAPPSLIPDAPSALQESFVSLSADWREHPRFLELAVRLVRVALDKGEVATASFVLQAVDDVEDLQAEPRLRSEEEEAAIAAARAAAVGPALAVPVAADPAASAEAGGSPSGSRPTTSEGKRATSSSGRPATGSKSPVSAQKQRPRKGQPAVEEVVPPKPLPRYTRSQTMWLSELELLRAQIVGIQLETVRMAERLAATNLAPVEPSVHNALGFEFDVTRASKLHPATAGMHAPLTTASKMHGSSSTGALTEGEAAIGSRSSLGGMLKLPSLSGSGSASSPRTPLKSTGRNSLLPSLTPRTAAASPGRVRPKGGAAGAEEARLAALAAAEAAEASLRRSDPALLEIERFRRLGRAAWFAARAESWSQLQSLVMHLMNALQTGSVKYTPADFAVRCLMLQPAIARHAASKVSNVSAATTSSVSPSESSAPAIVLTNAPSTVPSEADKASSHFASPLAVLTTFARKVLLMLSVLRARSLTERGAGSPYDQINTMHLQLLNDIPAVSRFLAIGGEGGVASSASSSAKTPSDFWFLSSPGLSIQPLVRLLKFSLCALFHAQSWPMVLTLGDDIALQLHSAFSMPLFPFQIYSAEEMRHKSKSLVDAKTEEIAILRGSFERDARLIEQRRDQRRSQRGKREEEERLQLLRDLFNSRNDPLQAELAALTADFNKEDARLTHLRAAALQEAHRSEPVSARALLNARCKLLHYYNEQAANKGLPRGAGLAGLGLDDLRAVAESREASRPVSRGGSVRDSEFGGSGGDGATATDDDDVRSMISLSSMGSTILTSGGAAAGSLANSKKVRKLREKAIVLVVRAYHKAVTALRADPSPASCSLQLGRALHELGDFAFVEYGVNHQAAKRDAEAFAAWHDALDQVFGTLQAHVQRAKLLAGFESPSGIPAAAPESTLLAKVGFWPCVSGTIAAAKLGRLEYFNDGNMRGEVVRMGAALARALFTCSVEHPARDVHFAAYKCERLWGGLGGGEHGGSELFTAGDDPLRLRVGSFLESLEFLAMELMAPGGLQDPVRALPILTLYEWVARCVSRSIFHTVRARSLKITACLQAGLLSEASMLYIEVMEGLDLPRAVQSGLGLQAHAAALPQASISEAAKQAAAAALAAASLKKRKSDSNSAGAPEAGSQEAADAERPTPIPPFNSHYPALHSSNRGFLSYLMGEGPRATAAHAPTSALAALYGGFLYGELRHVRAAFLCAVAQARDQLSPLMDELMTDDAASNPEAVALAEAARNAAAARRGKKPSGRPSSQEGGRPSSGGAAGALSGSGSAAGGPPSLAEKLATRTTWLRMAERIYAETVALFVPHDPSGKEGTMLPVAPASPVKKSRKDRAAGAEEAAAQAAQASMAARRRTTQNFPELSARSPPSQPAAATSSATAIAPPAVDPSVAQGPVSNLDLLTALSRDSTILPAALVSHAYMQLSLLKQAQGLLSDAAYFAKRSMRVMQDGAGSEFAVSPALSVLSAAPSAAPSGSGSARSRPRSPRSPGSLSPRKSNDLAGREGSMASLMRERTDAFVKQMSSPESSKMGGLPSIAGVVSAPPGPGGVTVASNGLLVVPPAPGAAPLSWRQMIDSRQWLRARLQLASVLVSQSRFNAASDQLALVDSEALALKDPLIAHESALLASRMLSLEGKFLAAFSKLRSVVWIEPTDADKAARAAMLAKIPGGEAALPPPLPRANTYAHDHGAALIHLLHLFRRLPKLDAPNAAASKGELHSAWVLQKLEEISLDLMEQYGLRPADLELAGEVLRGADLRRRTARAASLHHTARDFQHVVQQRLVGVVSLYHPWVASSIHFHFLAAKYTLSTRAGEGGARAAIKYALVAERLLALWATAPPTLAAELHALVAKIAWRRLNDIWSSGVEPNLDVGLRAAAMQGQASTVAELDQSARPMSPPQTSGKGGRSSRSTSPAQKMLEGRPKSPAVADKKKSAREKQAEAAALAAATLAAAQSSSEVLAQSLATAAANQLVGATDWEAAQEATPRPIRSRDPKSIAAVLARLHLAVQINLVHGAQHARAQNACALLVEMHVDLRRVAERAESKRVGSPSSLLMHQPLFHAYMAAFWLDVGARIARGLQYLQRHAVDELAAHPLPNWVAPEPAAFASASYASNSPAAVSASQPFPLPQSIQSELLEAYRLRADRRKQEVAFLLQGQLDPASAAASALEGGKDVSAFAAAGGRESRKDKVERGGRGGAASIPAGSDEPISTRSLLHYLLSLRAELSSRAFESELCAVYSAEESLALDTTEFLARSFAPWNEKCAVPWTGLLEQFFGSTGAAAAEADGGAAMFAAVRAAIDETAGAPGAIAGLWSSRAQTALEASRPDVASASERLSLTMLLSTDVQRGLVAGNAPATPAKGSRGQRAAASVSSASPPAASGAGSRKKKGAAKDVPSDAEAELTPAQLLFGARVGRFEVCTIYVAKDTVATMAAAASSLRHNIETRQAALAGASASAATSSSSPSSSLNATEQSSFLSLLQSIEASFGSSRPSPALSLSASPDAPSSVPSLLAYYLREYGLSPSLAELHTLSSVLVHSSASASVSSAAIGGAFVGQSNGVALFLHQFSPRSARGLNESSQRAAEKAAAAMLSAAASPLVSPASKGLSSKAERDAAKVAEKERLATIAAGASPALSSRQSSARLSAAESPRAISAGAAHCSPRDPLTSARTRLQLRMMSLLHRLLLRQRGQEAAVPDQPAETASAPAVTSTIDAAAAAAAAPHLHPSSRVIAIHERLYNTYQADADALLEQLETTSPAALPARRLLPPPPPPLSDPSSGLRELEGKSPPARATAPVSERAPLMQPPPPHRPQHNVTSHTLTSPATPSEPGFRVTLSPMQRALPEPRVPSASAAIVPHHTTQLQPINDSSDESATPEDASSDEEEDDEEEMAVQAPSERKTAQDRVDVQVEKAAIATGLSPSAFSPSPFSLESHPLQDTEKAHLQRLTELAQRQMHAHGRREYLSGGSSYSERFCIFVSATKWMLVVAALVFICIALFFYFRDPHTSHAAMRRIRDGEHAAMSRHHNVSRSAWPSTPQPTQRERTPKAEEQGKHKDKQAGKTLQTQKEMESNRNEPLSQPTSNATTFTSPSSSASRLRLRLPLRTRG